MPRFEFSEGTSNKFWEIALDGSSFTTVWGKIGTQGQSTTKSFDGPSKAKHEYDKLVAEKLKKGYQEVASNGAPKAAPARVVAAPVAKPVAAPAPAAQPLAAPPAPVKPGEAQVIVDSALTAAAARAHKNARGSNLGPELDTAEAVSERIALRLERGSGDGLSARALYQVTLEQLTRYLAVASNDEVGMFACGADVDTFVPLLERFGAAAIAPLATLLRGFAAEATPRSAPVNWQKHWNYAAAVNVAAALKWVRNSSEAAAAVAFALGHFATLTLSKDIDPRPALIEYLRNSPEVALAPVQAAAKDKGGAWAKELLPQLERLAGRGPDLAEASDGDLPAGLRQSLAFKAPAWWMPAAMTRPVTLTHKMLPLAALDVLAARLKAAFEGAKDALDDVKAACTPESLADFGWDLFNAWQSAGAPPKEKWAFVALGALGNDQTARKLTPLIRAWPGESQHARAVLGLDVLGAIGSDVAMMMLNGVAQKVKFKGLQERARLKMDEIAATRGLTAEELADRLVPDLDLEDDGSKTLDFGPRSFRVGFDEALSPFVMDATGARLKDLPKPNSKDDATVAGPAVEAWKAMKKDARTLSGLQILRLELAMGNARRWSPADFEAFLVRHPLLIHVVRRVVWGAWKGNKLIDTFRVAEDRTLAGRGDETFALPGGVQVGVVHRLQLGDADAAAWAKVFGDYELLQPFEQLGRQTYTLSDEELRGDAIKRFEGRVIETKKLLGLGSRGWRRGAAQDAGNIFNFYKPIAKGLLADLDFSMGINAGGMDYVDPTQTLGTIHFVSTTPSWSHSTSGLALSTLDPVIVSEVLRDVDALGVAA